MAGIFSRFFDKIKAWIAWSWTYLWALWFILVVFVVYILRGPLKIGENVSNGKNYCIFDTCLKTFLGHWRCETLDTCDSWVLHTAIAFYECLMRLVYS